MKSMTGYGWAEAAAEGWKVTVELSSVNRKQCEVAVTLPRELEVLEAQVRDEVNRAVARGRVTVRVALHQAEDAAPAAGRLNRRLARVYAEEFRKLGRELGVSGEVTLDQVLRAPGVLEGDEDAADAETFWPAVSKALKAALTSLVQMREREGAHLAKDLEKRIKLMRRAAERVARRAPQVQKRYREQLLERVRQAGLDPKEITEERLSKEIVLFADRSDISEEVARLRSHFAQFDTYAASSEPLGRTLDFLAQEMNREINTLGAKANDADISREVVILKTELEKFREQAMNVE